MILAVACWHATSISSSSGSTALLPVQRALRIHARRILVEGFGGGGGTLLGIITWQNWEWQPWEMCLLQMPEVSGISEQLSLSPLEGNLFLL